MAFLKTKDPGHEGVCDLCGDSLEDAESPVEDGDHEFCSAEHKKQYEEEHEHEDDEEKNVCEFC